MESFKQYLQRKRREYEAKWREAEVDEWVQKRVHQLDHNKVAKAVAGQVAGYVGRQFGAARGVYNDAKAIKDGAVFAHDLVNSRATGHDSAVAAGRRVLADGAHYVATRAADPSLLLGDFEHAGAQMNRSLNQYATPQASTLADEIARQYNIGMNQGEAGYHLATLVFPVAGEIKGAAQLGRIGRMAKPGPAKYIALGASPELAKYFAQPYHGMGAHLVPRRTRLPGGAPVPKALMDSRFNVLKPKGVERGAMFERHFQTDGMYHGGRVPAEFGGGGWSGRRLGWKRHGPVERLWHGTPGVTKAVVVGGPATLSAVGRIDQSKGKGRR